MGLASQLNWNVNEIVIHVPIRDKILKIYDEEILGGSDFIVVYKFFPSQSYFWQPDVDDLLGIVKCYSYDEGKVKTANQLLAGRKLVYNSTHQQFVQF